MKKHLLLMLSLLLCLVMAFTSCSGAIDNPGENPSNPSQPTDPDNPDNPDEPDLPETTNYTISFIASVPEELSSYDFSVTGLNNTEQVVEEGKFIEKPEVVLENRDGFFVVLTEWVNEDGLSFDSPVFEDRTYEAKWAGVVTISSSADLVAWLESADDYYSSVVLNSSIDMTGVTWNSKKEFYGCFDGNGHTISNLNTTSAPGLIEYMGEGSAVRNLTLSNVSFSLMETVATGAIASRSAGLIENCSVSGTISSYGTTGGLVGVLEGGCIDSAKSSVTITCAENQAVGGIFGSAIESEGVETSGYVADSESSASIETASASNEVTYLVGGVGGTVSGPFEIRNCEFSGDMKVVANSSGAGIIGQNDGGKIIECISNGTLSAVSDYRAQIHISGIIGENLNGSISNCTNNSDITIDSGDVAGIAFINNGGIIDGCENNGEFNVSSGSGSGIVNQNISGTISNSVNNANFECGGVAGIAYSSNDGKILFCSNLAKDFEAFGSAGGIVYRAGNTIIMGCTNNAYLHSRYNYMGDRGGGIVGIGGDNTIIACSNTGELYNYSYTYGITSSSSDTLVSCFNSGPVSAQNINSPRVASITERDVGQIHTCVSSAIADSVYSGSTNNVEKVFWNGITIEEGVAYMNEGIDAWNAECESDFYCDFHYELVGDAPAIESGSPSGGSSEEPDAPGGETDEETLRYIMSQYKLAIDYLTSQIKLGNKPAGVTTDPNNILGAQEYTITMENVQVENAGINFVLSGTYEYSQSGTSMIANIDLIEGSSMDGVGHTAKWTQETSYGGGDFSDATLDAVVDGIPLEDQITSV